MVICEKKNFNVTKTKKKKLKRNICKKKKKKAYLKDKVVFKGREMLGLGYLSSIHKVVFITKKDT